jgi:hypothetical protein
MNQTYRRRLHPGDGASVVLDILEQTDGVSVEGPEGERDAVDELQWAWEGECQGGRVSGIALEEEREAFPKVTLSQVNHGLQGRRFRQLVLESKKKRHYL